MRLAALAIVLAVTLAGCVEGPFGGAARGEAVGILPAEARAKADAAALAWKEDAALVTLRGDAHDTKEPGLFTFGNPGAEVFLDGRAGGWQFSYAVPGTVALMMATVDADGEVDTRQIDLSTFTPATGGYEEYFEMTPVDDAWLDMRSLVAVLRDNDTTRPFTEGNVDSVVYSLKPDVRSGYAWTIDVARDDATLSVALDPATWTFLEMAAAFGPGATASYEKEDASSKPPSGLTVRAAYGLREPGEHLSRLRFDLAYSKASRAFPLAELAVQLGVGETTRTYRVDGAAAFEAGGVEGDVEPGARFTLTVPLEEPLPPRSHVKVAFLTPKGAPARYEASTPLTYGKSTIVALE